MTGVFQLLTPVTYWILILLWSFILYFYINKMWNSRTKHLFFPLILILAIDAFRTLFESIYFGFWYTSLAGIIPTYISKFLMRPEIVAIPKILNVVAAVFVIILLIRRWLPREENEIMYMKSAIKESEEKYRMLFESMVPGVVYQDTAGAIIDANSSAENLLGLTLDQMQIRTSIDQRWKAIHEDGSDFPGETHPAMVSLKKGVPVKDVIMGVFNLDKEKYHWINVNAIPQFKPGEDKPFRVFTTFDDITEGRQAKLNLISSNERLLAEKEFSQTIINTNHTIIVGLDKNHLIRIFSRGAEIITGYSKAEVLGKDWNALFLYFENQENLDKAWKATWEQNYNALSCSVNWDATQENNCYTVIGPLRIRNGATRTILWQNTKIHTGNDESKHLHISIGVDITERKQAEEKIKASLKEKEVLLQEIHHRVKNNMQVIISLLKLQSGNITDKQYLDMFKESQNRIKSMALVHEKLYQTKNLADVDFKGYVKSLVISLFRSYKTKPNKITLKIEVEDVSLGLEKAIPCGLIINELVSNSLKYAFPEERAGEIKVAFNPINEDELVLEVSDNGIGMPEKLDFRNTKSLGLHLVTILSEDQLHGTIELNRTDGA